MPNGHDVIQGLKEMVKLAEQGDAEEQYRLGLLYERGQCIHQDYVMAHMYLSIAADSGHKNAKEDRDSIAKKMTPSQLAEAQDLAREWMQKHQ
jgi:uncharacterized protein